jgi:hypothetical protein
MYVTESVVESTCFQCVRCGMQDSFQRVSNRKHHCFVCFFLHCDATNAVCCGFCCGVCCGIGCLLFAVAVVMLLMLFAVASVVETVVEYGIWSLQWLF